MKIEYLPDGSDDCPLIRLFGFTPHEASRLKAAFDSLANEQLKHVRLEEVVSLESVDGSELAFAPGKDDKGITQSNGRRFEMILTPEGWATVAGLTEPFCERTAGFQWLCHPGDINLLLSRDGWW